MANYNGILIGKSPTFFKLRNDNNESRATLSEYDALFVSARSLTRLTMLAPITVVTA